MTDSRSGESEPAGRLCAVADNAAIDRGLNLVRKRQHDGDAGWAPHWLGRWRRRTIEKGLAVAALGAVELAGEDADAAASVDWNRVFGFVHEFTAMARTDAVGLTFRLVAKTRTSPLGSSTSTRSNTARTKRPRFSALRVFQT